jgi:tetratricopeptide (TPR) repeat protein
MPRRVLLLLLLAAPCLVFGDESPTPSPSATPQQDPAQTLATEALQAFDKNDMEGARKKFQKLLDLQPDNFFALVNIGEVEYRLKKWDDAGTHLKRAVRLQPESGKAWLALGALYCDQEKLDEALAALSQAVLYDPKNPKAHNYLGVTVGKKGWYSGAEAELQRAIELDPDYAEAHFNLALSYLQRTPPAVEMARRHYMRALQLGEKPDPLIEKQLDGAKK